MTGDRHDLMLAGAKLGEAGGGGLPKAVGGAMLEAGLIAPLAKLVPESRAGKRSTARPNAPLFTNGKIGPHCILMIEAALTPANTFLPICKNKSQRFLNSYPKTSARQCAAGFFRNSTSEIETERYVRCCSNSGQIVALPRMSAKRQ
jgi:hypothetical protein